MSSQVTNMLGLETQLDRVFVSQYKISAIQCAATL